MGVALRAHPVRGESHIQCNANGEVATTILAILVILPWQSWYLLVPNLKP